MYCRKLHLARSHLVSSYERPKSTVALELCKCTIKVLVLVVAVAVACAIALV